LCPRGRVFRDLDGDGLAEAIFVRANFASAFPQVVVEKQARPETMNADRDRCRRPPSFEAGSGSARRLPRRPRAERMTAFPLEIETRILGSVLGIDPALPPSAYGGWGTGSPSSPRPFATPRPVPVHPMGPTGSPAHLAIAIAFISLRDPVRNVWVVTFGMIACLGVIPLPSSRSRSPDPSPGA
jgi:hypothetical protein